MAKAHNKMTNTEMKIKDFTAGVVIVYNVQM